MWSNYEFFVTISAGVAAFLFQFGTLIWKISKAEATIHDVIAEVRHEADLEIQEVKQAILSAKLEMAENYLRKDTFSAIMTKIESWLLRLENKLDKIIESK